MKFQNKLILLFKYLLMHINNTIIQIQIKYFETFNK